MTLPPITIGSPFLCSMYRCIATVLHTVSASLIDTALKYGLHSKIKMGTRDYLSLVLVARGMIDLV